MNWFKDLFQPAGTKPATREEPKLVAHPKLAARGDTDSSSRTSTSRVAMPMRCEFRTQPTSDTIYNADWVDPVPHSSGSLGTRGILPTGTPLIKIELPEFRVSVLATRPVHFCVFDQNLFDYEWTIGREGICFGKGTVSPIPDVEKTPLPWSVVRRSGDGDAYIEFRLVADLIEQAPPVPDLSLPTKCLLRSAILLSLGDVDEVGPFYEHTLRDRVELLLPILSHLHPVQRKRPLVEAMLFDTLANLSYYDLSIGHLTIKDLRDLLRETIRRDCAQEVRTSAEAKRAFSDLAKLSKLVEAVLPGATHEFEPVLRQITRRVEGR